MQHLQPNNKIGKMLAERSQWSKIAANECAPLRPEPRCVNKVQ
jgi:hypothetical protein